MWTDRSINFVEACLNALKAIGPAGSDLTLDDVFDLHKLELLPVAAHTCSPDAALGLLKYMEFLPGYSFARTGRQSGSAIDQHGWVVLQMPSYQSKLKAKRNSAC